MIKFLVVAVKKIIKVYMVTVFILFNALVGMCLFAALLESLPRNKYRDDEAVRPGPDGRIVAIEPGSEEYMETLHEWAYKGYAPTQYDLGSCYERGFGVPKDIKKALRWYRKAAKQGDGPAIEAVKRLESEMAKDKQQDAKP